MKILTCALITGILLPAIINASDSSAASKITVTEDIKEQNGQRVYTRTYTKGDLKCYYQDKKIRLPQAKGVKEELREVSYWCDCSKPNCSKASYNPTIPVIDAYKSNGASSDAKGKAGQQYSAVKKMVDDVDAEYKQQQSTQK